MWSNIRWILAPRPELQAQTLSTRKMPDSPVSEWVSSFLTAHQHILGYLLPCNDVEDTTERRYDSNREEYGLQSTRTACKMLLFLWQSDTHELCTVFHKLDVRVHCNATSSSVFYFIILSSLFQSTCLDERFAGHHWTTWRPRSSLKTCCGVRHVGSQSTGRRATTDWRQPG